jgi:hypothetical protein
VWGRGEVCTGFGWEHVARVGERRGVYRVWVGKPEGMRRLVKPRHIRVYGRIILKRTFMRWDGEAWTGVI